MSVTSSNYYEYVANGQETLNGICNTTQVSVNDVVRINTQVYSGVQSVGDKLTEISSSGKSIPAGIVIRLPYYTTGSQERDMKKYDTWTEQIPPLKSSLKDYHEFNCTVALFLDGEAQSVWALPVYPNEFSDSNNGNFSALSILGRSVDHQIYNSSSRSVSVTLNLHEELCTDYSYIHSLVAAIESAAYPGYNGGIVQVPTIQLVIGSQFKIRGILQSCSAVWKAPIIDGQLVNCDVSLGILEVTGPFSISDIQKYRGYRSG